eukprot:CAMPEP_0118637462 /NCGR_PEP_ID=MMETSP0785-20121206/3163_1 /TAXON_ID=91992 /ORGANISM="Bolidomonas pacifica, Strain CCMP 1866" /LENGTH=213 /DNA_ID=CAMNT_0006528645 /DNA_START=150 /DNA_END=788 /DNA_ORIENTATION=+
MNPSRLKIPHTNLLLSIINLINAVNLPPLPITLSPNLPLQLTASLATYITLISIYDRPLGKLNVNENIDVAVKNSKIPGAGLGLFALRPIPVNTELGEYPGVLVPTDTYRNTKLKNTNAVDYAWKLGGDRGVLDPTTSSGKILPYCYGGSPSIPFSYTTFQYLLFPIFRKSTLLTRINEPLVPEDMNVDVYESQTKPKVKFYTCKDVAAGEEL